MGARRAEERGLEIAAASPAGMTERAASSDFPPNFPASNAEAGAPRVPMVSGRASASRTRTL